MSHKAAKRQSTKEAEKLRLDLSKFEANAKSTSGAVRNHWLSKAEEARKKLHQNGG